MALKQANLAFQGRDYGEAPERFWLNCGGWMDAVRILLLDSDFRCPVSLTALTEEESSFRGRRGDGMRFLPFLPTPGVNLSRPIRDSLNGRQGHMVVQ